MLQAFAPLAARPQRAIYVFGCNSIACSADATSWVSVRVCRTRDEQAVHKINQPQSCEGLPEVKEEIDWDTQSESSGSSDSDGALAHELELLSLEVQLTAAKNSAGESGKGRRGPAKRERSRKRDLDSEGAQNGSEEHSAKGAFDASYVEVDYEPSASKLEVETADVSHLLTRYLAEEKERGESGTVESFAAEEEDEEAIAKRNFEEFQERISRAPTQILRYQFGGSPLWPKVPAPIEKPETCDCGKDMVFELQLLGSCLHYLHPDKSVPEHQKEAGMNFASVAIFTCAADCTEVNIVAENRSLKVISQAVVVQQDEW